MPHTAPSLDANLIDCANHAWRIAPKCCATDLHVDGSCAWYHGFWPTLRALALVTTPDDHRAFYRDTLDTLTGSQNPRVLISGAADFGMLEQVLDAFDRNAAVADITVIDRCPTAVALTKRYAARRDLKLEARAADILALTGRPFDIICTHSFMGYFDDQARQHLFARWRDLLRPGGHLVTINRIRPKAPELVGFTPIQKAQFSEKVQSAVRTNTPSLNASPSEIVNAAALYADKFHIHPVRSAKALRQSLESNGFRIEAMDEHFVAGHAARAGTGPTTPAGARYLHLVARRR